MEVGRIRKTQRESTGDKLQAVSEKKGDQWCSGIAKGLLAAA